jgi:hypothetical protein
LLSTYQLSSLSSSQKDNSLWNILVLRLQYDTVPDRVTFKTPHFFPFHDEKERYFIRSLFQKKALSAWWMSTYLSSSRVWELVEWYVNHVLLSYQKEYQQCFHIFQHYEQLLGYSSDEFDIIVRCLAVSSCCLSDSQQTDSFRPMVSVSSLPSLSNQRAYSIPTSCLYASTYRGRIQWSQNDIQLHHVEKYLIGCPYWDDIITKYAIISEKGIQWKSDDAMESFYDTYFQQGIPDEWTKDEKQKSHGNGILGPNEPITLSKFCSKIGIAFSLLDK